MAETISALVVAVINAALQLVVAFGVSITDAQNAAITGTVNAVLALAVSLVHLRKATKPAPAPTPAPAPAASTATVAAP